MKKLMLLSVIFAFLACKEDRPESKTTIQTGLITQHAMVVSAREEASRIGTEIMKKGGNAFDAMIATEMALAVVHPYAGNLGGGGFMVYRTGYGETGSFDYREKAPLQAHRDMYLDTSGNYLPEKSTTGGLAIGVPGTIAGIFAVHEKLGSLPMEIILAPVIELAEKGFIITINQAERLNATRDIFLEVNKDSSIFTNPIEAGARFQNPNLAKTLKELAKNGRAAFYEGSIGKTLVSYVQKNGGIMSMEDLKAYEAVWREPLRYPYKDLNIITMAPPSSGGICLGQLLGSVESFPLSSYGHNSEAYIQVLTEAARRTYADRSYYLGDPDFITIPTDSLLSPHYLKDRMQDFSLKMATPSISIKPGRIKGYESTETTHYSIVDAFGNAVSATTTLNDGYGSKVYCKELGFFLNNEMDDFSAKPGTPNLYGLIGGEANAIAPQKRMLSSMTPTIVEKEGELYMVVGSPGGARIITSVFQTILNVYEFGLPMQEAVNRPRFHHQWIPDTIYFEPSSFPPEILRALRKKGYPYDTIKIPVIGVVDAILVREDGKLEAGADKRMDDTACGY